MAANFLALAAGSALEQKIGTGNVDLRKSITNGLVNTVSGAIYGDAPLKSADQAFWRGGVSGAAESGINYLSNALNPLKTGKGIPEHMRQGMVSPYARQSDLSGLCNAPDPFAGSRGYPVVRGYQYDNSQAAKTKGFKLADFGKELLSGFVMGGLSSAAFYSAGKVVEAVKGSIRRADESGGAIQTIHNRYPREPQVGREIGYSIEGGRIHVDNGVQNVDFVIDMDSNLHIGSGHSYLANGADVQAAGTMKINNQGYVRSITNASGHYAPTVEQGRAFPNLLNDLGIRTKNAWLELGDYSFTSSGYVDVTKSSTIVEQLK